jgi:cobalamin synthase
MEKLGLPSYRRSIPEGKSMPAAQCETKATGMNFDLSNLITDTARALGFLTRLPVPSRYFEGDEGSLAQVSRAFPLAGFVAALPAALFLMIAPWLNFPPLMAALIAVAISIGTTGALHEDGLADVADGFFGIPGQGFTGR